MELLKKSERLVFWGVLAALVLLSLYFYVAEHKYSPEQARQYIQDPGAAYWETPKTPFLTTEEAIIIVPPDRREEILPVRRVLFEYVEVKESCGVHYEGECVNIRSGPGVDFPVVAQMRNNVVLKVDGKVERDGSPWFKIIFDEWLRYPERITTDWFISGAYVDVVLDEGDKTIWDHGTASTTKRIIVDRSEQKLTAYENGTMFMEIPISTGLELTPTPRGTFSVFKKTPSRYMQGPLPGIAGQYYDLPGVPWNLYFSHEGAVIHGAYWHESFGSPYSHGCVNLPPDKAKELYAWAELGTLVIVED